jgi:hypothetical protein
MATLFRGLGTTSAGSYSTRSRIGAAEVVLLCFTAVFLLRNIRSFADTTFFPNANHSLAASSTLT